MVHAPYRPPFDLCLANTLHQFMAGPLCIHCGKTKNEVRNLSGGKTGHNSRWQRRVDALAARDGYRCRYCGCGFSRTVPVTLDHVLPRSKGGTDDLNNLVLACRPCNAAKADRVIDDLSAVA